MTPRPARLRALAACVLLLAACAGPTPPAATPAPAARGHLFIVGGGPRPPELMRRFVELAGGPGRARIVVFPMASGDTATGPANAAELRALGADAVSHLLTRAQAGTDSAARLLEGATGIWFSGGDQNRLTAALLGTPVEAAIHRRWREGAVVGGTSAGAAVMSAVMITGDERRPGGDRPPSDSSQAWLTIDRDNVVTARGFGLLPGAIVDQHFVRRRRHNRLVSLALEHPALVAVGIDEATALVVGPDGRWRVLGASVAVVYDARQAQVTPAGGGVLGAAGIRMHVLPPGSVYDPRAGRVEAMPAAAARAEAAAPSR